MQDSSVLSSMMGDQTGSGSHRSVAVSSRMCVIGQSPVSASPIRLHTGTVRMMESQILECTSCGGVVHRCGIFEVSLLRLRDKLMNRPYTFAMQCVCHLPVTRLSLVNVNAT